MAHFTPVRELFLPPAEASVARAEAAELPAWTLTPRQLCDLELLLNGGFSPLTGFLGRADYDAVCAGMRLACGALWPIPVTLDVSAAFAATCAPGSRIALRTPEGVALAILTVTDRWSPDRGAEARAVYGTDDVAHPGVAYLRDRAGPVCLGGPVEGIEAPAHHEFAALRHSPNALRARFAADGWMRVVAFQTRNPLHRAHHAMTLRAMQAARAPLLLHPAVGPTQPGDLDPFTRIRCTQAVLAHYPPCAARLSLLNLAMRMAGPREALWHGLIRRNHGATHFIVGRDHAGPGADAAGRAFYAPYAAQTLFAAHEAEAGIEMVPFRAFVHRPQTGQILPEDEVPPGAEVQTLSGTALRARLQSGAEIPEWFTFPEVADALRRSLRPRDQQGLVIFFTGLSGAGKSTLAKALMARLQEISGRPITTLDGDAVRRLLSSGLGFSRADRDLNIRRIGFVAAEVARHGGIAICAPIAPYAASRAEARAMVAPHGTFIEVHVATSLEECERRDRKGLYALARAGQISAFTGISDPYEVPERPDLRLQTEGRTVQACVDELLAHLQAAGLIAAPLAGQT